MLIAGAALLAVTNSVTAALLSHRPSTTPPFDKQSAHSLQACAPNVVLLSYASSSMLPATKP